MSNDIQLYEGEKALVHAKRMNYALRAPSGRDVLLKRDVDFGVIKGTKKPSLYKAGAEKIAFAYGLMQRYIIESKIEEIYDKDAVFYYLVRCDLVKMLPTGQEIIFTSSYGSANTREKRNGLNGPFDAANSALKMAQKRALVGAAISICGGSDLFTQDIEDETFVSKNFDEMKKAADDEATITAKQLQRLYAIGGSVGKSKAEVMQALAVKGYTSTKDIKQKDYDELCAIVGKDDGNKVEKE